MKPIVFGIILLLVATSAAAQTARRPRAKARPLAKAAAPEKIKIAEGRYQMTGIQPGHGFEEPWTLWKTKLGYELVEQWVFPPREPNSLSQIIDVNVQMVTQLRPVKIHIGDPKLGLDCAIALNAFNCQTQGKADSIEIKSPYDFFSPSPWMLGNIVRRARKVKEDKSSIRLVRVNSADEEGAQLSSFEAEVQFVGDDQVEVDGVKQPASIYELKAANMIPAMLVWVSDDGIVYAIQDSSRPDQRLELTSFQRHGKM